MNKLLLACGAVAFFSFSSMAETVNLEGKDYEVECKIDRQIGPGITHLRYRLPDYPLNINVVKVDLNNPYNRIETTVANESAKGTELLVNAAKRQSSEGHRAVAGANANFWVVATQPEEKTYTGTTRNASVRNGVIVTESNQNRDQWDGGTMRTGVVSMSYDKTAYIDYCTSSIAVTNSKIGTLEVHQCNKGIHTDELCMYNRYYGSAREFMPIKIVSGKYEFDDPGDATEVILDFAEGEDWNSGRDIEFIVKEVRTDAGNGMLGNHDLALVGRGPYREVMAALAEGDKLVMKYSWTYNPGSENEITPLVEQAVGGNALVMRNGELTAHNSNETYNSQVYSRTGYGCSADGKTLYIVVIDKSTDPVYGTSAGCNTAKMCEFARWLGCSNMANFDAGGSTEMFITDRIENRTTEGTPRAVANGWLVYNTAPEDTPEASEVAALAFEEMSLTAPAYGTFSPTVIAYNKYGAVISYDFRDFTLSCDPELGTCDGNSFTAGKNAVTGKLTATVGEVSIDIELTVAATQPVMAVKPLLIDGTREYPIEISATIGDKVYSYNPADFEWIIDDTDIVSIDAQGVLRGLKEGKTTITAKIGDITESTEVTVEIANAAEMAHENLAEWTAKGTGVSNVSLSPEGVVTFTYGSSKTPYITIATGTVFYSLPDNIFFEFEPAVNLTHISADIHTPEATRTSYKTIKHETEPNFAAATKHNVEIPISLVGETSKISTYPVSISNIRLYPEAGSGQGTVQLHRLYARYDNYQSSVELNTAAAEKGKVSITPNPVAAGTCFTVHATDIQSIDIYSPAGALVAKYAGMDAETVVLPAPATPGAYVVNINSNEGASAAILIVK